VSFRARLILFFALIVLVPVAVVAVVLTHFADESRTAQTDASLTAGAETALALFARDLESAAGAARAAGRDETLARALRSGDRRSAQRAVERLARRLDLTQLIARDRSGVELAATGNPSPASMAVTVDGANRALGSVTAATLRPDRYVTRVANLTGDAVALLRDDRVMASTVPLEPGDLPAGEGTAESSLPETDSRALTTIPEGAAPGARIAVLAPLASSGLTASPTQLIATAIAFLALGLICVVLLVRALGGQVREMLSAAHRIGGGDFSQRVPVTGDDELAGLAREFNTMSERLDRLMGDLRTQGSELDRSLKRTGEAFAAAGDRLSILQVAADAALSSCGADVARVTTTGSLPLEAAAGVDPGGPLEEVLREVEDRVIRDRVSAEAGAADVFAFGELVPGARATRGPRTVMAVARAGEPFDSAQRETLRYFAGQVAVALENVELHDLVAAEPVTSR
jgi:HAMP domain-containing protein